MNYRSGDKFTNRYLSSDAFTSLKNKLGGRSITSLGNRRQKSYRVANQGFDLLDYKTTVYRILVILLLATIIMYIVPQTRYMLHGFVTQKVQPVETVQASMKMGGDEAVYSIAPVFLKTDEFIAKQKDVEVPDGVYVRDYETGDIIGTTSGNSSSTVHIRLFSEAGFKNNFLIQQELSAVADRTSVAPASTTDDSATTSSSTPEVAVIKEKNYTYTSYVFEGTGYGQITAKVPPKTEVKTDSYIYIRTTEGLKPIAKIMKVDEDNKSTFTIVYAQLMISPQNIYKVIIK